jgi:choline dehydrogenase
MTDRPEVIVVGAGAAGCVVARRLADGDTGRILLLEAGPDLSAALPPELRDGWRLGTPPDWGFESEPANGLDSTKLRRGRLVGGTSWLARFAVRGSPADFDAWAARGDPGWGFADVLETFRRVESDLDFGNEPWHGNAGPVPITRYPAMPRSAALEAAADAFEALGFAPVDDHNRPGAVGVGPLPMSSRNGERVTTADAYLASDVPARLTVRAESPVDRVLLEGRRADGVRLVDGTVVHADRVIFAAGTYGTPTVLMRSGIGPAAHLADLQIAVVVDLPGVGANLADHPAGDLDSGWRGHGTPGAVLHTIATARTSAAEPAGPPDLMFWASDPGGEDPRLYFDPILLKPISRGSVRLRSADPTAPPRITLPDVAEPADLDRLVEGLQIGVELANRPEIRRVSDGGEPPRDPGTKTRRRQVVLENRYSIPHVVGTCRMGPLPNDGDVVDADGRVHGVDGLFVADASVIPDAPSGFPHLITIMLAEHLVARWARSGRPSAG